MRKGIAPCVALACLLGLMVFLTSSCIYISGCDGSWHRLARYERKTELSAPLTPGSSLSARTRDGSIRIEGTPMDECRLMATIVAHASTPERAEEIAEQIDVRLEPRPGGLAVVIEKPGPLRNAQYGVSLAGTVPTRTNLTLITSDGSIHLASIEGTVDIETSDGSIRAKGIKGDTKLRTSDGSIDCSHIQAGTLDLHTSDGAIRCTDICVARLNCRTSDGSVHIECAADAPRAMDATVTASDGSITFAAPPGLSAVVDASVSDGAIRTSLPITVEGKIGKSLLGTVGNGEGRITLKTHDGSITIR